MVRASKGPKKGTRRKLKTHFRLKFKSESYLKEFKANDKVIIKIDPSSHRAFPHPRFKGVEGKVIGKRGRAYVIKLNLGNKSKTLMISPEHLKKTTK